MQIGDFVKADGSEHIFRIKDVQPKYIVTENYEETTGRMVIAFTESKRIIAGHCLTHEHAARVLKVILP